jgi:TPR repeat protein
LFQTADVYHRWGLYTLHYIEEHYAYLERCIDAIVFGGDDIDRRLEELFMEYSALFAEIRAGETISLRNGIERFVAFKEEGSRDEAMALLERMIKQDFPQAKVEMAKLLAEGRFVDKDLRKALDLIQEAKDQGMGSADRDLFDILWREGDPGYYQQMVELVLQKSEEGNKWAMQRMAKAYRYGIGVEKDLVEAAELMSKVAASNRSEEVRDIYFDLLLEVDDPARYEEMVGSVYRLAMDGSPDPEARYGLA